MKSLAIYPGTFDPPTLGHLDVIERATQLFDRLIVSVGVNSSKSPLLTPDERAAALVTATRHLQNVEISQFKGLLVEYAQSVGAKSIVRGLRATADFEYEFQMAMINRRLADDIECVFLMTRWDYSYLSSSMVREVALLGGDVSSLIPDGVQPFITAALDRRG
jgi:pantetheine-phosphate adenylyltransferase